MVKMIVAVDNNWGIGKNNDLLFRIPEDVKFFKEKTIGEAVVMGRKTMESLPKQEPLRGRVNIVLTTNTDKDKELHKKGFVVIHSLADLEILVASLELSDVEVYAIGGGQIYSTLLNRVDKVYVTKIYDSFNADTFFPRLDIDPEWKCTPTSEIKEYEGYKYQFFMYERRDFNAVFNYGGAASNNQDIKN